MSVSDRSKFTPIVKKLMAEYQKIQLKAITEFLKREENKGFNFWDLWTKLMDANKRWIDSKGKDLTYKDLNELTTHEERILLAKIIQFTFDYTSDLQEKENPLPAEVKIENVEVKGVPAEWQIVPEAMDERVFLYIHGGGMVIGSPRNSRYLSVALGGATKMKVLSVDYRLAPEHPHPAGQEDCFKAYQWLIENGIKPENIIIGGLSAGGYYTITTLLRARDAGMPLPRGGICLSPATDLREESTDDLFYENARTDPILADSGLLLWCIPAYLGGKDPNDPYISPILADLRGLPPLLIQASTSEMLYSGAKKFYEKAREAGVDVTFETWDDVPHGFQVFGLNILPEAQDSINHVKSFVEKLFNK